MSVPLPSTNSIEVPSRRAAVAASLPIQFRLIEAKTTSVTEPPSFTTGNVANSAGACRKRLIR